MSPKQEPGNLAPSQASSASDPWETAYLAFETPEQEIRKFTRRLRSLGASAWPEDAEIVELFCGRGSGLHALRRLGFQRITGVDLSPRLIAEYRGAGQLQCCDCRKLPFADASYDIVIVQGGLHHLPVFPQDLDQTLAEVKRVLRLGGRFVVVEPWLTPFLRLVHTVARRRAVRRCSATLDALQTMIDHEISTYEQWLRHPGEILANFRAHFSTEACRQEWGKLLYVGRR